MSFLCSIFRSWRLQRSFSNYKKIHERFAYNNNEEENPSGAAPKIIRSWGARIYQLYLQIKQHSILNFLLSNLALFLVGVGVTVLLYAVLLLQAGGDVLSTSTRVLVLCLPFLVLGLALSERVRCYSLLLLPSLASRRGRQALVMYAALLVTLGPASNISYNLGEMADSLSCGLEQARIAIGRLSTAAKQPYLSAKRAIEKTLDAIKLAINNFRKTINPIQRIVMSIASVLKSAVSWLHSAVNLCNRKLGTPTERCMNVLHRASSDCVASLGPLFVWLCSVVYVGSIVCHALRIVEVLCHLVHLAAQAVSSHIEEAASRFAAKMHEQLYVDVIPPEDMFQVHVDTGNKTLKSIASGVRAELELNMAPLRQIYHAIGGIFGLVWILVFFKAVHYYHKFMRDDRYDNFYITEQVREINLRRMRQGQERVLPLTLEERAYYCKPAQLRWLVHERGRLWQALLRLLLHSLGIALVVGGDLGLHWLLDRMRQHSTFISHLPSVDPGMQVEVEGRGLISDMFRNISAALLKEAGEEEEDPPPELDPAACLPNPSPPDLNKHHQIAGVLLLAWLLALIEPLVLRLRPALMSRLHPERAKSRAIYLTGKILRERGGLWRTAERFTGHRLTRGGHAREALDFRGVLEMLKDRFKLLRMVMGGSPREACYLCAAPASSEAPLRRCETPGCQGRFCGVCLAGEQRLCPVCAQEIQPPPCPEGLVLEEVSSGEEGEEDNLINKLLY